MPENQPTKDIVMNMNILNGSDWEMLCALTGMNGSIDSPKDIVHILGNVYVNERNLADGFDHELTREDIPSFANKVREALSPNNENYVTIMNRNSLIPDPRAVIMDTQGMEEPDRISYDAKNEIAITHAADYLQRMHQAAIDAKAWLGNAKKFYTDTFVKDLEQSKNIIIPNLITSSNGFSNGFQRQPEASPQLYMLSKGYTFDDVFFYDPDSPEADRHRTMNESIRDEFYDIFSLAKDENGQIIKDPKAPENIKKYNEVTYPTIVKMMETLSKFRYDYIDMSEIDSLKKLALYSDMGHVLQEFSQQLPHDYGKNVFNAAVGPEGHMAQHYENCFDFIGKNDYAADIKGNTAKTDACVYYHEMTKCIGGYKGYMDMPSAAQPCSQSFDMIKSLCLWSIPFEVPAEEYEEFKKDPQHNFEHRFNSTINPNRIKEPIFQPDVNLARDYVEKCRSNTKTGAEIFEENVLAEVDSEFMESRGINKKESIVFDPADPENSALKLLSKASGLVLSSNSPASQLNVAIDNIVINGISLREFSNADSESVMDNVKTAAEKLSVVFQGLYTDGIGLDDDIKTQYDEMTDNGKKPLFVFKKNKAGELTPYRIRPSFRMPQEDPENTPLEQVSSRQLTEDEVRSYLQNKAEENIEASINKIMEDNTKRYHKWQNEREQALNEDKIVSRTSSKNTAAEAYAKQLNNEVITDKDRNSMHSAGIEPYPKITLTDIRSGRAFMGFLAENKDSVNISNICINGISIKDYFKDENFSEKEADIVASMFRNMADMHKLAKAEANLEEGKNPFGTSSIPFIAIKNEAGKMVPFTFEKEKVPSPLPNVRPLTPTQRFFSRKSTIEANERAIKEYDERNKDIREAINRNGDIDKLNEVAALYSKMYNGQRLSTNEKYTAQQYKLNAANIDKNAQPAIHMVNAMTLENEAHPNAHSLASLQPVHALEHSENKELQHNEAGIK